MRKFVTVFISALMLGVFTQTATAKLAVFACEPEWAALVDEIGGDAVSVYTATTAAQDPHHVQARPSLIARARRADLMICTGAELEIGWLPQVQRQSGNPKIQTGAPGYFEAASVVPRLEIPAVLDRARGDIHASGNPHIQTSPRNIALVATALVQRMATLDPAGAATYQERATDFNGRWEAAIARWETTAQPLQGLPLVVHHKSWVYLIDWLKLREVATLEEKPGIPPSVAHLDAVLGSLSQQAAVAIIRAPYDDPQPTEWLSARAKIPTLVLPGTIGGLPGTGDLFGLFDVTVDTLLGVAP